MLVDIIFNRSNLNFHLSSLPLSMKRATFNFLTKVVSDHDQGIPQYKLQTNLWHRQEEPYNTVVKKNICYAHGYSFPNRPIGRHKLIHAYQELNLQQTTFSNL